MKKQTYIQNICSIIFAQSVDTRKYVRYNRGNQEQMFATHVRVFVFIVNDINKFLFPALAGAIYGSSCKAKNENF